MKHFLLKIASWTALALLCHLVAAFYADGATDEHYLKFTGERRSALVLGTSRAAQGIDPAAFDTVLREASHPDGMLNFSFNLGTSPYGPTYLKAIEKKVDTTTRNGLFIVCVDPWSLSAPKGTGPEAPAPLPEDDRMLARQWTMNGTPNLEYLIRSYPSGWGSLIGGPLHDPETYLHLHANGWLEVRVPMDNASLAQRRMEKVAEYSDHAKWTYAPSGLRIGYLERTIDLLEEHGTVVLLRLPTHQDLLHIEEGYWSGFTTVLNGIAARKAVLFLDHSSRWDQFTYTDGNHLAAFSVPGYSRMLAAEVEQGLASSQDQ
jgi:hypothetical protein